MVPVILFHAGFEAFGGGYVGVDVFFVISGYLITSILLREMDEGSFSLLGFYERRARRILPALFFIMLLTIPFAWAWLMPRDLKEFAESVLAVTTFSSNILFWQQSGYFDTQAELKPLLHTWSLAVEEQYYILFPLLLMATWRLRKHWILVLLLLATVVSLALAEWSVSRYPAAAFYLLPTRGWEILIGAIAAFHFNRQHPPSPGRLPAETLSLLGLGLIAYAAIAFTEETPFPSLYTLVPTVGTLLIILFARAGTLTHKLLSLPVFVGIGLISYSAYLWHQPLFAFAKYLSLEAPPIWLMLVLTGVTFPLAYLSWRFIEKPFRSRQRVSGRMILASSLSVALLLIGLGYTGVANNGFDFRLKGLLLMAEQTARSSPLRDSCHTGGENFMVAEEACNIHHEDPDWVAFGDSHNVELSYAMAEALKEQGKGIKQLTVSFCAPSYLQTDSSPCTRWTHQAVDHVLKNDRLQNIVFTYRIAAALHGDHVGVFPALPDDRDPKLREAFWRSYVGTLKKFTDAGKTVYLVLQAPEVKADVHRLFRLIDEEANEGTVVGAPRSWWRQRMQYVNDRRGEIPEGVIIIDPADLFCDDDNCYAIEKGTSLYFDDDHMSVEGASRVARHILERHEQGADSNPDSD